MCFLHPLSLQLAHKTDFTFLHILLVYYCTVMSTNMSLSSNLGPGFSCETLDNVKSFLKQHLTCTEFLKKCYGFIQTLHNIHYSSHIAYIQFIGLRLTLFISFHTIHIIYVFLKVSYFIYIYIYIYINFDKRCF